MRRLAPLVALVAWLGATAAAAPADPADRIEGLPLIEVAARAPARSALAVILTGDGGWGVTDRGIARTLADHGIRVVGLDARRYFRHRRTPDEAATDLRRVLDRFGARSRAEGFVLVGYSLGADVLPFLADRLPAELLDRARAIVLIRPSTMVDFQAHVWDWFGSHPRPTDRPVLPEIGKLRGRVVHCFCGREEKDSLCPSLDPRLVGVHVVPGGHRVGDRYGAIADTILTSFR